MTTAPSVDEGLLRRNRRKRNAGLGLLVVGLLLAFTVAQAHLPAGVKDGIETGAIVTLIVAAFLLVWAEKEASEMSKPIAKSAERPCRGGGK
jgi:protein-S-isoprenylcysteine O-methyltransferase Ste14